jgi:hypothetical protein
MNRRQALKSLVSAVPAGAMGVAVAGQPRKYGLLTVEGYTQHQDITGERLHVWLDGEDVTHRCCEADDINGYVVLQARTKDEHAKWAARGVHRGGPWAVEVHGNVVIGTPQWPRK